MDYIRELAEGVRDGTRTVEDAVERVRQKYPNIFTRRDRCSSLRKELVRLGVDGADGAKLTQEETECVVRTVGENLEFASQNVHDVEALPLLAFARRCLMDYQNCDILDVVISIAIVTGRRMVEVAVKGRFVVLDDEILMFYGQAKKRGDTAPYAIPTLAHASLIVAAHERVIAHFEGVTPQRLNSSFCPSINARLRNITNVHFHALRMVYALVTFEACRPHTFSLNAWVARTLGHSGIGISVHYTKLRVVDIDAIVIAKKMKIKP